MEWDDLRHFAAFAEKGSLLAAARQLGVEHATISRRIEALEASLKVKLVDRRGRRLALTPEGERIAVVARGMEVESHAVRRIADAAQAGLTGDVTITAPPALAAHVLAPHLARLGAAHPNLTVRILGEARHASLERREADLAIRLSYPEDPELVRVKLMEIAFRPYANPAYLSRTKREDWIFIASDGDVRTSPQQKALDALVGNGHYGFSSSDVSIQANLAVGSAGVAMLPDFIVQGLPLTNALPDASPLIRDVFLVMHGDMQHTPRIRAVVDHLRQSIPRDGQTQPPPAHRPAS
ncbi:LysR family transcriptional regulator [Rhizobium oryzicola]|uniref:LysR family transcriptional regulator n=1 Tax=Rhizobium oryzicola TaxID=1232668 RepID=A0ABT8T3L0_9HYPH|nr:LysR family transcriptional regulator [Rhizobium oryzicola]MDO1584766.1 LysR family transcriptional regulator [Rhizobium oryzicola]